MAIEVLTQFLIPRVPQTANEAARKADIASGAGPGNMPTFWIDAAGDLWYKGEPGMFRINAAGDLEYVFTGV